MNYTVLLLILETKYPIEHMGGQIGRLKKDIARWCQPGLHTNSTVGLLVVTSESSEELAVRIAPCIENLTGFNQFWCFTAPEDIISQHGQFDPLMHRVRKAWVEARKRNRPQNVRYPQRRR